MGALRTPPTKKARPLQSQGRAFFVGLFTLKVG